MARVVSVNVGTPQQISVRRGRPLMSAIGKAARRGPRARGRRQPRGRRPGRPPRPRRAGQGRLRLRVGGQGVVGGRARPRAAARHVRREPHHRGHRRQRRGDRRALADRDASSSRSASRGCRASSSGCASATSGWSSASARPAGPAPTCASSARASCRPGDEIEVLSTPDHGVTSRQVSDAILLDDALLGPASAAPRAAARARRLDGRARRLKCGRSLARAQPGAARAAALLERAIAASRGAGADRRHPGPVRAVDVHRAVVARRGLRARRPHPRAGGARRSIQATLMRGTIHLVSRADFWPLALAVRAGPPPARPASRRRTRPAVRAALAGGSMRRKELEAVAGHGVHLWTRPRPRARRRAPGSAAGPTSTPPPRTGSARRPRSPTRSRHLVERYLGGFGPASRKDIASFTGLTLTELARPSAREGLVA